MTSAGRDRVICRAPVFPVAALLSDIARVPFPGRPGPAKHTVMPPPCCCDLHRVGASLSCYCVGGDTEGGKLSLMLGKVRYLDLWTAYRLYGTNCVLHNHRLPTYLTSLVVSVTTVH